MKFVCFSETNGYFPKIIIVPNSFCLEDLNTAIVSKLNLDIVSTGSVIIEDTAGGKKFKHTVETESNDEAISLTMKGFQCLFFMDRTKYVCFKNSQKNTNEIIVFTGIIEHSELDRVIRSISSSKVVPTHTAVSAGFVNPEPGAIKCFGQSISLRLNSNEDEDTRILIQQFKD